MKIELELDGKHSLVSLANDATLVNLYRTVQDVFLPELAEYLSSEDRPSRILPFHLYYKAEKTYCLRSVLEWEEVKNRAPIDRLEITVRRADHWPLFMHAATAVAQVCPCHLAHEEKEEPIKAVSLLDGSEVRFSAGCSYSSAASSGLQRSCILFDGSRLQLNTSPVYLEGFGVKLYQRIQFAGKDMRGTVLGTHEGHIYVEIDADCTPNQNYEIRKYSRSAFEGEGIRDIDLSRFQSEEDALYERAVQQSLIERIRRLPLTTDYDK